MGFTTVVEPAMAPHHALQTHLELNDVPIIDKGALTVLGNDDFLLRQLRDGRDRERDQRLCRADGRAARARSA